MWRYDWLWNCIWIAGCLWPGKSWSGSRKASNKFQHLCSILCWKSTDWHDVILLFFLVPILDSKFDSTCCPNSFSQSKARDSRGECTLCNMCRCHHVPCSSPCIQSLLVAWLGWDKASLSTGAARTQEMLVYDLGSLFSFFQLLTAIFFFSNYCKCFLRFLS